MNQHDWAKRIADHLDRGLDELPPRTLYRLRLAREKALSRRRDSDMPDTALAPDSTPTMGAPLLSRRVLVPLFVLILALTGLVMWQQHAIQNTSRVDLAELDAQVLSDELPVTAYLDQGFEVWLYHHTTTE
jgi:hypothetical protein